MAGDGLESVAMTGRWVGFYRHRSEQLGAFPITAEIRQEGHRIMGEMYDQITERSNFLEEILERHRDEYSSASRSRMEGLVRHFGTESVVVHSRLRDTSDLDGKITGDRVEFTKSYRGSHEVNWTVGEVVIGTGERSRHMVEYSGQIDREKGFLAGQWFIRRQGLLGRFLPPRARGTFELYHKT